MNTIKTLAAVLVTVAATAVSAQEATPDTWITQATSTASRQDVHNEARAALAAGKIAGGEAYGYDFSTLFKPTLTRAQVAAEAIEALRLGLTQGGEVLRIATPAEAARILRAGQLAVSSSVASR